MDITISPSPNGLSGELLLPSSKSVSHRMLLCAGLCGCDAEGTQESRITRLLDSADSEATLRVLTALGCKSNQEGDILCIKGVYPQSHDNDSDEVIEIDCGESGSTLRFAIPIMSLTGRTIRFTGAPRLMERPQSVYQEIFEGQGLLFDQSDGAITLKGALKSGKYRIRGDISSQFVTGLLMTLPLLKGDSLLEVALPFESRSYADLTIQVISQFGVKAEWLPDSDECARLFITGAQEYKPCTASVEGDYSQLGFFGVAAAIGGSLSCKGLSANSAQGDRVILELLSRFGAECYATVEEGENVVKISSNELNSCAIDLSDCPDLGPALMVLAAFSKGEATIYNAGRLRIKESDRLAAMESELKKLNVLLQIDGESMIIKGRTPLQSPVTLNTHNDHRIAMSLAIFAAYAEQEVTLLGAECVEKSYPNFFKDFKSVGGLINKNI